jgi:hypothetical protein
MVTVCVHCGKRRDEHVSDKCLFEASNWRPGDSYGRNEQKLLEIERMPKDPPKSFREMITGEEDERLAETD